MSAAGIMTTADSPEAQLAEEAGRALALAHCLGSVLNEVGPHLPPDARALLARAGAAAADEAIFTEAFQTDLVDLRRLLMAAITSASRHVDLQASIVLSSGEPAPPYWSTEPTPTSQALTDRLRVVEALATAVARTRQLAAGIRSMRALLGN